MMNHTYDITYQYSLGSWHTHYRVEASEVDELLRMLFELGRNCRVRHNATGEVVEVAVAGKEPLTLLHLFFKSISDRNGKDADNG